MRTTEPVTPPHRRRRPRLAKSARAASIALALVTAACGGGTSKPSTSGTGGAGGSASPTGTGGAAGDSGSFITADLDGVPLRGVVEARALWFPGLVQGYLALSATTGDGEWTWSLAILNQTGPQPCKTASVQLQHNLSPTEFYGSYMTTMGCSFAVSSAAPNVGDVLAGTFEAAQLDPQPTNLPAHTVTGGAFHLVRVPDQTTP